MNQREKILERLEQGPVSNVELNNKMYIFRYAARIHELKKDGYNIKAKHVKDSLWMFELIKEPEQVSLYEMLTP